MSSIDQLKILTRLLFLCLLLAIDSGDRVECSSSKCNVDHSWQRKSGDNLLVHNLLPVSFLSCQYDDTGQDDRSLIYLRLDAYYDQSTQIKLSIDNGETVSAESSSSNYQAQLRIPTLQNASSSLSSPCLHVSLTHPSSSLARLDYSLALSDSAPTSHIASIRFNTFLLDDYQLNSSLRYRLDWSLATSSNSSDTPLHSLMLLAYNRTYTMLQHVAVDSASSLPLSDLVESSYYTFCLIPTYLTCHHDSQMDSSSPRPNCITEWIPPLSPYSQARFTTTITTPPDQLTAEWITSGQCRLHWRQRQQPSRQPPTAYTVSFKPTSFIPSSTCLTYHAIVAAPWVTTDQLIQLDNQLIRGEGACKLNASLIGSWPNWQATTTLVPNIDLVASDLSVDFTIELLSTSLLSSVKHVIEVKDVTWTEDRPLLPPSGANTYLPAYSGPDLDIGLAYDPDQLRLTWHLPSSSTSQIENDEVFIVIFHVGPLSPNGLNDSCYHQSCSGNNNDLLTSTSEKLPAFIDHPSQSGKRLACASRRFAKQSPASFFNLACLRPCQLYEAVVTWPRLSVRRQLRFVSAGTIDSFPSLTVTPWSHDLLLVDILSQPTTECLPQAYQLAFANNSQLPPLLFTHNQLIVSSSKQLPVRPPFLPPPPAWDSSRQIGGRLLLPLPRRDSSPPLLELTLSVHWPTGQSWLVKQSGVDMSRVATCESNCLWPSLEALTTSNQLLSSNDGLESRRHLFARELGQPFCSSVSKCSLARCSGYSSCQANIQVEFKSQHLTINWDPRDESQSFASVPDHHHHADDDESQLLLLFLDSDERRCINAKLVTPASLDSPQLPSTLASLVASCSQFDQLTRTIRSSTNSSIGIDPSQLPQNASLLARLSNVDVDSGQVGPSSQVQFTTPPKAPCSPMGVRLLEAEERALKIAFTVADTKQDGNLSCGLPIHLTVYYWTSSTLTNNNETLTRPAEGVIETPSTQLTPSLLADGSYRLSLLEPCHLYCLELVFGNEVGRSPPSSPVVCAQTLIPPFTSLPSIDIPSQPPFYNESTGYSVYPNLPIRLGQWPLTSCPVFYEIEHHVVNPTPSLVVSIRRSTPSNNSFRFDEFHLKPSPSGQTGPQLCWSVTGSTNGLLGLLLRTFNNPRDGYGGGSPTCRQLAWLPCRNCLPYETPLKHAHPNATRQLSRLVKQCMPPWMLDVSSSSAHARTQQQRLIITQHNRFSNLDHLTSVLNLYASPFDRHTSPTRLCIVLSDGVGGIASNLRGRSRRNVVDSSTEDQSFSSQLADQVGQLSIHAIDLGGIVASFDTFAWGSNNGLAVNNRTGQSFLVLILAILFALAFLVVCMTVCLFLVRRWLKNRPCDIGGGGSKYFDESVADYMQEMQPNARGQEAPVIPMRIRKSFQPSGSMKIENLSKLIDKWASDSYANLLYEFKDICAMSLRQARQQHTCDVGRRPENAERNRYPRLLPYDSNYVQLTKPWSLSEVNQLSSPTSHDDVMASGNGFDRPLKSVGQEEEKGTGATQPLLSRHTSPIGDPARAPSTYMNASWVPSPCPIGVGNSSSTFKHLLPPRYIATQGPTQPTLGLFWQMIWDHDVGLVINLTKSMEDGREKSAVYWPESSSINLGRFNVELLSGDDCLTVSTSKSFVIRHLLVTLCQQHDNIDKSTPTTKHVIQLHMLEWPDYSVPQLDDFHQLLSAYCALRLQSDYVSRPVLAHCSAGIGRTGTFICLDQLAAQLKSYYSDDDAGENSHHHDNDAKKRPVSDTQDPIYSNIPSSVVKRPRIDDLKQDDQPIYANLSQASSGNDHQTVRRKNRQPSIDVFQTVLWLRNCRTHMVHREQQYVFIFRYLSYLHKRLTTPDQLYENVFS